MKIYDVFIPYSFSKYKIPQYTQQFYYFPDSDKAPMFVRIKKCEQTTCGNKKSFFFCIDKMRVSLTFFPLLSESFPSPLYKRKGTIYLLFFRELQLCQALNCSHFFKDPSYRFSGSKKKSHNSK
jgi:hypothetical protein